MNEDCECNTLLLLHFLAVPPLLLSIIYNTLSFAIGLEREGETQSWGGDQCFFRLATWSPFLLPKLDVR